jgi:hypothetical protein
VRALALFLALAASVSCGARWTEEDKTGDMTTESLMSRIYALDAGDEDYTARIRAYSRQALCATQGNLARHDAGRLVGPVSCVEKRE